MIKENECIFCNGTLEEGITVATSANVFNCAGECAARADVNRDQICYRISSTVMATAKHEESMNAFKARVIAWNNFTKNREIGSSPMLVSEMPFVDPREIEAPIVAIETGVGGDIAYAWRPSQWQIGQVMESEGNRGSPVVEFASITAKREPWEGEIPRPTLVWQRDDLWHLDMSEEDEGVIPYPLYLRTLDGGRVGFPPSP